MMEELLRVGEGLIIHGFVVVAEWVQVSIDALSTEQDTQCYFLFSLFS